MTVSTLTPRDTSESFAYPHLKLKDIVRTLPKDCFKKDMGKAWRSVGVSIVMVALGYVSIAVSPWFLLPIAWFFTGTALTGFFVIGHDCGHRSFSDKKWVNDLVGHLAFAPLIYPFHCWRIMHNKHHRYTNKMDIDNAWQPFRPEAYESLGPLKIAYRFMRGKLWWLASVIHWALVHFQLSKYKPSERRQVKLSIAVVVLFAAIVFPTLLATGGIWGLVKWWVMPWLGYHFWMSTFTLVHHTAPSIDFQEPDQWDEARAQLSGTVHCDYPIGVEFLCHHINVHVPHHISTAIPSYNLRKAHESLKQNWSGYVVESKFIWDLMRIITDECHMYHPETFYQSFRTYHRSLR